MADMNFGVNIIPKDNTVTLGNNSKAWNIVSPNLTGTPVAPTATSGTDTTQVATTQFVQTAISPKVTGPASATNNAVAIFDGTGGKTIKSSGYTIGKSVPSDAKFTDTTYSAATQSAAGLMSSTDKTKLDGVATGATANVVSNSLTDTSTTNALSAAQGKALNDKISTLDTTTVKLEGTQTITGNKTFSGGAYIKNSSATPHIDFAGRDLANANMVISAYASEDNSNQTYGNVKMRVRQHSPSSDGSSLTDYHESYYLPAVDTGMTANTSYDIMTTKNYAPYDGLDSISTTRPLTAAQGKALNDKITSYDVASNVTVSDLATALNSLHSSMNDSEVRNIRFKISTASEPFAAVNYLGTIRRLSSSYAVISVQPYTGVGAFITGRRSSNGSWSWESVSNNITALSETNNLVDYKNDTGDHTHTSATGRTLDLNAIVETGAYSIEGASNGPNSGTNNYGCLNVIRYSDTNYITQIWQSVVEDKIYIRRRLSGTWEAWNELALNTKSLNPPDAVVSDCNTFLTGVGQIVSNTANRPCNYGTLLSTKNGIFVYQTAISNTNQMFFRKGQTNESNPWGSWEELALNSNTVRKTIILPAGTDYNTVLTSGFYRIYNNNTNLPGGAEWGQLIVSRGEDTIVQLAFSFGDARAWVRSASGVPSSPNFTPWREIITTNKVINSLTSTDTTLPLSAAQGKALNDTTVKLSGTQTIGGSKTFSGTVNLPSMELYPSSSAGHGGYIDFHYNASSEDKTSRIIESQSGFLNINNLVIPKQAVTYTPNTNDDTGFIYFCLGSDTTGTRCSLNNGFLINLTRDSGATGGGQGTRTQFYVENIKDSPQMYHRSMVAGSWGDWNKIRIVNVIGYTMPADLTIPSGESKNLATFADLGLPDNAHILSVDVNNYNTPGMEIIHFQQSKWYSTRSIYAINMHKSDSITIPQGMGLRISYSLI